MPKISEVLSEAYTMGDKIKLYIPSTYQGENPGDPEVINKTILDVIGKFSAWFGGSTCYNARGGYLAHNGDIIQESIVIVESFGDPGAIEAHAGDILTLAKGIKLAMLQESIAIEHNNRMYIIE